MSAAIGSGFRTLWAVFVKICGITTEEDGLLAVAMGADAVGFVFAPSPRQIAVDHARDIARRLPPDVLTVGVFRDEAPKRVVELCHRAGLRAAQLHGRESPEDVAWVRARVGSVIKAFPAGSPALDLAATYGADAVMIDSHAPGSGEVFDWSLAEGAPVSGRFILAGGLTPENVAEGIERVRPWGVDVSTGVESSPGHKDPIRVRDFIRNARIAAPAPYEGDLDHAPYNWDEESYRR
jgi:phosphoribosylanthranilate isomerase